MASAKAVLVPPTEMADLIRQCKKCRSPKLKVQVDRAAGTVVVIDKDTEILRGIQKGRGQPWIAKFQDGPTTSWGEEKDVDEGNGYLPPPVVDPDGSKGTPVYVFGSNRCGWHGGGAARFALDYRGAVWGQARGRMGNSYAIVTLEVRPRQPSVTLIEIACEVRRFVAYARANPTTRFEVAPIGCKIAGWQPAQIAPLFRDVSPNVQLPPEFTAVLAKEYASAKDAIPF